MKKSTIIVSSLLAAFSLIACALLFLPAISGSGVIGTYLPVSDNPDSVFTVFRLKANNKAEVQYRENSVSKIITWYAKCDRESTSIYFVDPDSFERQFMLTDSRQLKDLYHNHDLYYKK